MTSWFGLGKRHAAPVREELLSAVVVKNQAVREEQKGNDLRLMAPLRSRAGDGLLGRLIKATAAPRPHSRAASEKTFELDELGAFVWRAIDGQRTVEDCIRHFSKEKRVNLREAEVAVMAFLKTLVKKGLAGIMVKREATEDRDEKV